MTMEYLIYEINPFDSHYFDATLPSMNSIIVRNEVLFQNSLLTTFTVFQMKGDPLGPCHKCYLTKVEYNAAHLHIVLNCNKVQLYLQ